MNDLSTCGNQSNDSTVGRLTVSSLSVGWENGPERGHAIHVALTSESAV